jgi:ATP-binding protein involved in chromosome partitioning
MILSAENVLFALAYVIEPSLKRDIVSLEMVKDLQVEDKKVTFSIVLTRSAAPFRESIRRACIKAIKENVSPDAEVEVAFQSQIIQKKENPNQSILPGVKNIVAIASGKGGVGKSTVTVNLALTLASMGRKVGLVDADIYGPSIPIMFDAVDAQLTPVEEDGKVKVLPLQKYGVSLASIGFFVDSSRALIWRGPMASGALKQLFTDVKWGELDYLLIDLPPGTGDIHLSLVQTLNLTGAIVVSTPQNVALADARKAVSMFENAKVSVKIIGMVENMAWFTPAELPENRYYLFGNGGCRELAKEMKLPFLGEIPLIQSVCRAGDEGVPAVFNKESLVKPYFNQIAEQFEKEVSIINAEITQ